MQPSRRDLLRLGLGTALLACGKTVPNFLAHSVAALAAAPASSAKGRALVVLQLDGGNDGLNTVVPYRDANYAKYRPRLRVPTQGLLKIDDHVGLHPALRGLAQLLEGRQLAIIQSVGYPNPNRSHFESMAIWHTAQPQNATSETPGWLARSLGAKPPAGGGDVPALHVGDTLLPQALTGSSWHVPSLVSLEQCRRRLGVRAAGAREQRAALDALAGLERGKPGSLLQFVERSTLTSYASSARLEGVLQAGKAPAGYPDHLGLSQRLKLIAQLLKAGLLASIYYTQLGGFDTHANQIATHPALLREVGDCLKTFLDDLTQAGEAERVVVLVFSEFGRRLAESASGGTDHGTAAPVLLLGPKVRAGLHGSYPNLQDLWDGDPKHAIDFRQVYATVLDQWLGCPSAKVLGAPFTHLPVLQA
jgi:uncharacterized protein (DUF1501 family)